MNCKSVSNQLGAVHSHLFALVYALVDRIGKDVAFLAVQQLARFASHR